MVFMQVSRPDVAVRDARVAALVLFALAYAATLRPPQMCSERVRLDIAQRQLLDASCASTLFLPDGSRHAGTWASRDCRMCVSSVRCVRERVRIVDCAYCCAP